MILRKLQLKGRWKLKQSWAEQCLVLNSTWRAYLDLNLDLQVCQTTRNQWLQTTFRRLTTLQSNIVRVK